MTAMTANARPARVAHPSVAARVIGVSLTTLAALWGAVGIVLFSQRSAGDPAWLFALPAGEVHAALGSLGWSAPVVFGLVLIVQTTVLVAAVVAAGFILAAERTTVYTALLAPVLVAFTATATCATAGWTAALPATRALEVYASAITSLLFFMLAPLFPTGTAVPRWSAGIVVAFALVGIVTVAVPWWTLGMPWVALGSVLVVVLVLLTIVAQARRYRRHSDRTEQQQMKWVVLSLSLFLISLLPIFILPPGTLATLGGPAGIAIQIARGLVTSILMGLIAVSIAFAIAKYRLFDVDLVIRRTVVAGGLLLLVGLAYFVVVGGAALAWQGSGAAAAVAATILVAFLAYPVRRLLERRVGRWVYGERGDPYRVVGRLSDDLRGLSGVEAIAGHVADVVVHDLRYSGAAVLLPAVHRTRSVLRGDDTARIVAERPLVHDGERIGDLVVRADPGDRLSAAGALLLDAVAAQAALALAAAIAIEEVKASRERLLVAREDERRRLYRDLHDGLGPALAGARQRIQTAVGLGNSQPEVSRELLDQAGAALAGMLVDVRELVHDLRPPALDDLGLTDAVTQAARRLVSPDGPAVTIGSAPAELPPSVEVAAYRIAVEAITNAVRHARADVVNATFSLVDRVLVVTIDDDGGGLGDARAGTGRTSMRERAEELGGTLRITPRRSGGTRVRAELPLPSIGDALT